MTSDVRMNERMNNDNKKNFLGHDGIESVFVPVFACLLKLLLYSSDMISKSNQ